MSDVVAAASEQVHLAAGELWPGEPVVVERQVPSVTSFVCRVRVGGSVFFAKVPFLGVSLVSLLRGAQGTAVGGVLARQRAYARWPSNLAVQEATHLRLLASLGRPRVCLVAGAACGVLFTVPVSGPTLTEMVVARPQDAGTALSWPLSEVRSLHQLAAGEQTRAVSPGLAVERHIASTFARKFRSTGGSAPDPLGLDRLAPEARGPVAERLRVVVQRLGRVHRQRRGDVWGPRVLTFGDLKPEHVIYPGGVLVRPVLLDPGLGRTTAVTDTAKLLSRMVLTLLAIPSEAVTSRMVIEALAAVVDTQAGRAPVRARERWWEQLMALWLMDTVNITCTYLCAPPELPVPAVAEGVVQRALDLAELLDTLTRDPNGHASAESRWREALELVREAVGR